MRTTERLRCTGCEREFLDMQSWRRGVPRVDAPPGVDQRSGSYLVSSYKDKDRVKTLGARWDPTRKQC